MIRTIQVFEHEKLTLHQDELGRFLSESELRKLYDYNDRNHHRYFTGIRDGIKFKSWVGVIQIGGLTLEILPKTDKEVTRSREVFIPWQRALLKMLAICEHIKVDAVSEASLVRRPHSLLDLYFDIFLDEVSALVKTGLIKKYRKVEGNTLAMKGRLVFSKHIRNNLIHQERLFIEHQTYDYEHLANQILLKALRALDHISTNTHIKDRINRIRLDFPAIKEIEIEERHFRMLRENRKNKPYAQALKIAGMIILNYSPDIRGGAENMLALIFDMNKLWEEYVLRMLKRTDQTAWTVQYQNSKLFWESKTVRPDLVLTRCVNGVDEVFVIDTKWKIIDTDNPSDEDLKQMFVYNAYWNSARSILIYPGSNDTKEAFGMFHKGRDGANECKLGFVGVLNEHGYLDLNVGQRILSKLN